MPMSKLRRRQADRRTFPIEWGHNGEAGVTIRGGAASVVRVIDEMFPPEHMRGMFRLEHLYRQRRKYRDVCIILANETSQSS